MGQAFPPPGDIEVEGRLPYSSNFTFLVNLADGTRAIYKPEEGEQPLHDFPEGLYKREVAAYRLSRLLGWPNVPETVVVSEAPYGVGSLQRFVDADFSQHYFSLFEDEALHDEFRRVATFDAIANNADRKSGHCIVDADRKVWCIDHGICFHEEPKLRTVIWEFGGEPVPADLLADVARIAEHSLEDLKELLSEAEVSALRDRARALLDTPSLPEVVSQRQYPWPLL